MVQEFAMDRDVKSTTILKIHPRWDLEVCHCWHGQWPQQWSKGSCPLPCCSHTQCDV